MKNFKKLILVVALVAILPSSASASWLSVFSKPENKVQTCRRNLKEAEIRSRMESVTQNYKARMLSCEQEIKSLRSTTESAGWFPWSAKPKINFTTAWNSYSEAIINIKMESLKKEHQARMESFEQEIKSLLTMDFSDSREIIQRDLTAIDLAAILLCAGAATIILIADACNKSAKVASRKDAANADTSRVD